MPTAVVCAAFDAATDAVIERLRERVEALGHRVRRAHRPHLTLAAARVGEVNEVLAVSRVIADQHGPIDLVMDDLGSFPTGVLFVRPAPSSALRALQRDIHEAMAARWPPAFGPQSTPATWVPHCTLATRLPRPALPELRHTEFDPFPAVIDAVAVILVGGHGEVGRAPLSGVAD